MVHVWNWWKLRIIFDRSAEKFVVLTRITENIKAESLEKMKESVELNKNKRLQVFPSTCTGKITWKRGKSIADA